MVPQATNCCRDPRWIYAIARKCLLNIARQFVNPRIADTHAKVAAHHVFQLVRLVKNYSASLRQNPRVACVLELLFNRQIREKKMVVDDYDTALLSASAHLSDKPPVYSGTLL